MMATRALQFTLGLLWALGRNLPIRGLFRLLPGLA